MTETPAANPLDTQRTEQKADKKLNIYTASKSEIFGKNFIAGMGRSLGSIVIYVLFITVISVAITQLLLPQLPGFLQNFTSTLTPGPAGSQANPAQIQQLLNQLGQ